MEISQSDIAKKMGLHPSSVSLALRKSPKISKEMQHKVANTAKEMGYHSNPYVTALMSARRQGRLPNHPPVIALITSSDTPDEWREMYNASEFYSGCAHASEKLGLRIDPFWIGDPKITAKRLNDILFSRGIHGAIFLPTGRFREKMNHAWSDVACVSYGFYEIKPYMDRVKADHYGNMEYLIRILKEKGFHRIGFVMDKPHPYKSHNRWLAAYLMGNQIMPAANRLTPWNAPEFSVKRFAAWLKKENPEVIICVHPAVVSGWLQQLGLKISLASLSTENSSFSGINEDAFTAGKFAIKVLMDRIYNNEFGPQSAPQYITIKGQWVDRQPL